MVASSLRTDSGIVLSFLLAGAVGSVLLGADAFAPSSRASGLATNAPRTLATRQQQQPPHNIFSRSGYCDPGSPLFAAKSGGGKKKRRRRKRKKEEETSEPVAAAATTATTTTTPPVSSPPPAVETPPSAATTTLASDSSSVDTIAEAPPTFEGEEINVADIQSVASFNFKGENPLEVASAAPEAVDEAIVPDVSAGVVQQEDGSIPLPDIKDTLRRKKMEANSQTAPGGPMEDNMPKEKIDRTDRAALLKVRANTQKTKWNCSLVLGSEHHLVCSGELFRSRRIVFRQKSNYILQCSLFRYDSSHFDFSFCIKPKT